MTKENKRFVRRAITFGPAASPIQKQQKRTTVLCSIWIQISEFVIRLCAAHIGLNVNSETTPNNKNPMGPNSQSDATCRVCRSPFNEKRKTKKSNRKLSPLIFYVRSSSERPRWRKKLISFACLNSFRCCCYFVAFSCLVFRAS